MWQRAIRNVRKRTQSKAPIAIAGTPDVANPLTSAHALTRPDARGAVAQVHVHVAAILARAVDHDVVAPERI